MWDAYAVNVAFIIIRSTHTGPIIEMYRLDVSRIMIFDWISATNRHVPVILRLNDSRRHSTLTFHVADGKIMTF